MFKKAQEAKSGKIVAPISLFITHSSLFAAKRFIQAVAKLLGQAVAKELIKMVLCPH